MSPKSSRRWPPFSRGLQGSWTRGDVEKLVGDLAEAEMWLHDVIRTLPGLSSLTGATVDAADACLAAKGQLQALLRADDRARSGVHLRPIPSQPGPGPLEGSAPP